MNRNYGLIWLITFTILGLVGGIIALICALVIYRGQNVDLQPLMALLLWLGGGAISFGMVAMLFGLAAQAVVTAIEHNSSRA